MIDDESQHKEPDCDSEPADGEKHQSNKCYAAPNRQEQPADYPGWRKWYRNPEYVFSGCVAAFTLVLMLTSVGQWSVMKGQLVEMSKEQRPWVLSGDTKTPVLKPGEIVSWDFVFDNFGKTPAINVLNNGKVLVGEDSLKKVTSTYFGTLRTSENQQRGSIVGPNDPRFRTAQSDEVLQESDIAKIIKVDGGVVLLWQVEYRDTAGNEYFTKVCKYTLKSGAIANCGTHNQIK
jgi:hypothetical protein